MSGELESPRKSSDASTSRRTVPKAKGKGNVKKRAKSPSRFSESLPFFESDPAFSDVTIVVDDKRLYSNKCLLSYHSKVFKEQLEEEHGKGKGGQAKGASKELNLSEHRFDDIVELCAYMDARVMCHLTDQAAMRLAPLAEKYDMMRLRKDCEDTLTSSYSDMRKSKKSGMMPTETTLSFLKVADKHKFEKLLAMTIEDCVDNPYIDSHLGKVDDDISTEVQNEILKRRNTKLRHQLAKKTRELEMGSGGSKEDQPKIWRR